MLMWVSIGSHEHPSSVIVPCDLHGASQWHDNSLYRTALQNKGRQEMEGWGRNVADKGEGSDKLRLLGTAWEAVLSPTVAGKQPSAKKAAGRVRCLAEQTARATGTTMAAAVAAVLNVKVVNWQHGVQCIKEQAKPGTKTLAMVVTDLAEQLSSGANVKGSWGRCCVHQ